MAYAVQAPTLFTSSRYHGRPDYSPAHTVPRLYHHQPSPSDGSSNGSSPSGSELNQHHRSPMDQGGHPPIYEGYPVSTDQNSPYGHSHMQHSGLSQELGTFRGQQTYQSPLPQGFSTQQYPLYPSTQDYNTTGAQDSFDMYINYPQQGQHVDDPNAHSTPSPATSSEYSHLSYDNGEAPNEETEEYLRRTLAIPPNMPLNLTSLPDDPHGSKPPKISDLIKLAIWGSPSHKLTLRQIYTAIEERYPSYKAATDKPWQRSIRHNLSLKAMFIRMERPVSHPGKGYYWKLNIRMGEGNKRDRKRKDPKADRSMKEEEDEYELSDTSSESLAAAHMASPSPSMRGMQRRPVHVDTRMYSSNPQGPMSFGPAFMPQANPMFPQAPAAAGVYGMGSGMPSPSQDPAYAMGPMAYLGHASWEMQDPARAPGPTAYPGMDGSAHRRMTGGMPVRQHHAHGPYPPMSVANQMQDMQMSAPTCARRHHSDTSPEDDPEEMRRGAPRSRPQ